MRNSFVTLTLIFVVVTSVYAQIPDSLSFQGYLTDSTGAALDTTVDMSFSLHKGSSWVWTQSINDVVVSDGLFNVVLGGAGSASLNLIAFNEPIDLAISVGDDPAIVPRTRLSASAYALGLRGLYTVLGQDATAVALNLVAGHPNNYLADGIVGATIGGGGGWLSTSSTQADSVLGSWATVAGGARNTGGGRYSFVGGGRRNRAQENYSTIGGGQSNLATGATSTVGGGGYNSTTGYRSTVGGGGQNLATGDYSNVGGGSNNEATGDSSAVCGGVDNVGSGVRSTVGGGYSNWASGSSATVPGGWDNTASGDFSFAAGRRARALNQGSFVWADNSVDANLQTTAEHQFLIRAAGGVGIGTAAPTSQLTVHGNLELDSTGAALIFPDGSSQTTAAANASTTWSLIGNSGTTSGTHYLGTADSMALEFRANAHRVARFEPAYHQDAGHSPNIILGFPGNYVPIIPNDGPVGVTISGGGMNLKVNWAFDNFATIGGGLGNIAGDEIFQGGDLDEVGFAATVSGGNNNKAGATYSTVGGGNGNEAKGYASVVSGGALNKANEGSATVCGGEGNHALEFFSSVLGGGGNRALGLYSTVSGGIGNKALGQSSTVPGGQWNHARGDYSSANGIRARANHEGSFVWNDNLTEDTLATTADNQFLIDADGGVGVGTNKPGIDTLALRPSGALLDVQQTTGRAGHFSNDDGDGLPGATLRVHNTSAGSGIAGWIVSEGIDATLVVQNHGTGDLMTAWAGGNKRLRITTIGEVYADGAFYPTGADVAEAIDVVGWRNQYEPGDVLEISTHKDRAVEPSAEAYSTRIAGVYATSPGMLLSEQEMDTRSSNRIPVAIVGIVPTKVTTENGRIRRGDLLVSSSTHGHAMRADPDLLTFGMVLGKAMESFEESGTGVIEVLLTMR